MNNSEYIFAIKDALKNALVRFNWYEETNDSYHLQEAIDWVGVACIYSKEIKNNSVDT